MKLKKSRCGENQKLEWWWNSNTLFVLKLKILNCDKTQKLDCEETQNLNCEKKSTQIVSKLKNSNFYKTQIVTKLNNSKLDRNKLWQNLSYYKSELMRKTTLKGSFSKTFWHLDNRWDVLWAASCLLVELHWDWEGSAHNLRSRIVSFWWEGGI